MVVLMKHWENELGTMAAVMKQWENELGTMAALIKTLRKQVKNNGSCHETSVGHTSLFCHKVCTL